MFDHFDLSGDQRRLRIHRMVERADRWRGFNRVPRNSRRRLGHAGRHVHVSDRCDVRAFVRAAVARSTTAQDGDPIMNARVIKYASVFNIGLQNTFVYRWNYFLRAAFGLIPLAGTVFLWNAVFQERGRGLHGYDQGSMIYYYLLMILVSNLVTPTEDEWQIAADIREGQINALLTKPMSYLAYRFSIFCSGRLVYTFVTLPPIAVIFLYFHNYIALPHDPMTYVLATLS